MPVDLSPAGTRLDYLLCRSGTYVHECLLFLWRPRYVGADMSKLFIGVALFHIKIGGLLRSHLHICFAHLEVYRRSESPNEP